MHFKIQMLIFLRKVLVIHLGDFEFELFRFVGNFPGTTETDREFFDTFCYLSVCWYGFAVINFN